MHENIKINVFKVTYTISLANHLLEHRKTLKGTSKNFRGLQVNNKRYEQIFKQAIKNGLTSFRNKGVVVITFLDTKNRPYGVLCDLNENNKIFVITVFRGPACMNYSKCFIKVHNRIHLNNYIMEALTESEKVVNKIKKINHIVNYDKKSEEDFDFLKSMERSGTKKILNR